MRGIGGSTLRGGQTVFHGIRMWGQLFQAAMLFAAFMTVAVPAWTLWNRTTGAEWYAAGMATLAETKIVLGYDPDSGQEVRFADGTRHVLRIRDIAASVPALEARERIKAEMFASAGLGALAGAGLIGLFLVVFWYRGARLGRQKRIRGAEMVTASELRRRLQSPHLRLLARLPGGKRLRPYSIAGIPYPERTETQHTIVSGTTGSGKTVLISDLVSQIRARGERCVIYDKMGSYTRSFFDPGRDVLMNPLDARAPRWSPFLEARNPRDFDMMAAALIPQQKDTVDPFWVTAARQLFSNGAGVFWKKGVTDNKVLVDHLLKTDLTELAEAMEGTVAQSIVDPENPKTALSVRAMLTANLSALEFLPDEGKPFSIREWISDEDREGFLFLTSRGDQHASLRGLISTWLEIAVNAMLTLAQDDGRRIWVILDELPTLHQVPVAPARPRRIAPVRRLLRARRPGRLGAARPLRAQRRRDDLRPLRHPRGARRARPRHRAMVGRQPRAERDRRGRRGLYLWRQHHPRRGKPHAPARTPRAGAAVRDHAARQSRGLSQVPRPLPGRLDPAQIRRPPGCGRAVRAARRATGRSPDEASASARPGEAEVSIPEPPDPDEAGPGGDPDPHDMPPEPAAWQGELDLVPLPGEAGDPQSDTASDETADGKALAGKGEAPDADPETPAQAPQDGAPDADTEPVNPPRCADAGGGRGSEWL